MRKSRYATAALSHAVGVPEIDSEHDVLLRLCQDSKQAAAQPASAAQLASLCGQLAEEALKHFAHEEREMREGGDPLYDWHRGQHRTARSKIVQLAGCVECGDRRATLQTLEAISKWLSDHIRLADRMLAAHLRNRRRALAAKPS